MAAYREAEAGLGGIAKAAALVGSTVVLAAGVAAVAAVRMAGNFQTSMTQLVTGAGESRKNLDLVSAGILNMTGEVGASASDLAAGMYLIESAGFRGAAGLEVLRVSAEGAKVGQADMATVANAVTSALNAYNLPASAAVKVTNDLVATVAAGKLHMEDLAGSLGKVLPAAAAAGVSLAEVTGAIATMTSQGTSAAEASTYLRQTILQLENPSKKAKDEMLLLGLNAADVSTHLGSRGLTGTLTLLTDAITAKMGPSGTLVIEKLRGASSSAEEFDKAIKSLDPSQQTYIAALADMVGGTRSMQAALQLTGPHMATFKANVAGINAAVKEGGTQVRGWSDIQQDLNFQVQRLTSGAGAAAIALGTQLIPQVTNMFRGIAGNLPNINAFATSLGQGLANAIRTVSGFLNANRAVLLAFGQNLLGVIVNVGRIIGSFLTFRGTTLLLQAAVAVIMGTFAVLNPILGFIADHMNVILPVLSGIVVLWAAWNIGLAVTKALNMASIVIGLAQGLIFLVGHIGLATAAQTLFDIAMDANPIGLVIIAIAALAAGLVWAYKNVGWFHDAVNGAWDGLQRFANWVNTTMRPVMEWILDKLQALASAAESVGSAVSSFVGNTGGAHVSRGGQNYKVSQMGGHLFAGESTLTGERGPEWFTSRGPGYVWPTGMVPAIAGGGGGISVNVYAQTNADPYEIGAEVGFKVRSLRRYL